MKITVSATFEKAVRHLSDIEYLVSATFEYRLPMAGQVWYGTRWLLWSLGVREVVGLHPGRGNSKESPIIVRDRRSGYDNA